MDAGTHDFSFPRKCRILRAGEFRRIYREGFRVSGPYFRAFCRERAEASGPRVGFTVPRALGKAVQRNRIKRRLREAVRHELWRLAPQWDVVFNPHRSVLEASFEELRREIERVFRRCNAC